MTVIREPAVAGSFYPGDATQLGRTVEFLLDEVRDTEGTAPKALIVPHAGYIYSGPVAATAYARLRAHKDRYERVILLGPCHRVPVSGLAVDYSESDGRSPYRYDFPASHRAAAMGADLRG